MDTPEETVTPGTCLEVFAVSFSSSMLLLSLSSLSLLLLLQLLLLPESKIHISDFEAEVDNLTSLTLMTGAGSRASLKAISGLGGCHD
jgi:hypothetical protein